jgi:hypothetical protein
MLPASASLSASARRYSAGIRETWFRVKMVKKSIDIEAQKR